MCTQKKQKSIKIFINDISSKAPKRIMLQIELMFILRMTFGVQIY